MPKNVDHDEYRKELLQKCFDLFGREGFSNVTMRQIAEEIGVSTGALYHYFPTKVSILEQMFAWAVEQDIQAFSPQLGPDLPLSERLKRISDFYVASAAFHQNLLLLALDLFRHSPGGSENAFRQFAEPFEAAISQILGTDLRVSEVICTYLVGFALRAMLTPQHFSYKERGRSIPDVLRVLIAGSGTLTKHRNGKHVPHTTRRIGREAADPRAIRRRRQPENKAVRS